MSEPQTPGSPQSPKRASILEQSPESQRASFAENASKRRSVSRGSLSKKRHSIKRRSSSKRGSAIDMEPEESKHMPCPILDISFDIAVPYAGSGEVEASPMLDEPVGADFEEVVKDLQQPYSVLRLRLKDRLEKLIATVKLPPTDTGAPVKLEDREIKKMTWKDTLSLRETPGYTGGAYMMRGLTPGEAPFFGYKHDFTGSILVHSEDSVRPPMYQPFREEDDQPDQLRARPTAASPSGERSLKGVDDRVFHLVR